MNDNVNLDYDSDLAADALQFGLKAQGVNAAEAEAEAEVDTGEVSPPVYLPRELYNVLIIAREVYGETNSEHSEVFCDWVSDILEGRSTVRETKEMLELLHNDKQGFTGRLSWQVEESEKVRHMRARRHASICAMNIVRAVLNRFKGLSYDLWLERSRWRATRAETDAKDVPY